MIDFWTCNQDEESLHCTTVDEAIDEYLFHAGCYDALNPEEHPRTLIVYGFSRMVVKIDPEQVLDYLIDMLDDEYNSSDECTKVTDDMRKLVAEFTENFSKLYTPFNCEKTATRNIVVSDWLASKDSLETS